MEKHVEPLTKTPSVVATQYVPAESKYSLHSSSGSLPILHSTPGISTNVAMLGDEFRTSVTDTLGIDVDAGLSGHLSAPGRLCAADTQQWNSAAPQATQPSPSVAPTRYVAGNEFFNYATFGSLRAGGAVTLWSKAYAGYAFAAFASGYINTAIHHLLLHLSDDTLRLADSTVLQGFLTLQWSVVFVVGVVSDSIPMHLPRRRPIMIVAWFMAKLLWLILFFVSYSKSNVLTPRSVSTALVSLAYLSLLIATNTLDIRIIELSQQEHLRERGRLLCTYQMTRVAGELVMHMLITLVARPHGDSMDLELPFCVEWLLLHLAVVCGMAVAALVRFADEKPLSPCKLNSMTELRGMSRDSLGNDLVAISIAPGAHSDADHTIQGVGTLRQLWRDIQQKVMWQIIVFNCIFCFFGEFEIAPVRRAMEIWISESATARSLRLALKTSAILATIAAWRQWGLNSSWRKTSAVAILSWVVVALTSSSLIAFDIARCQWLYTLASVLRGPIRAFALLLAFVPTIEIAHLGSEGSTYALVSTFESIMQLLSREAAKGLVNSGWSSLQLTEVAVLNDLPVTRRTAFFGVLIAAGSVLSTLLWLRLLPQQKLDAQQLRVYGGYSKLPVTLLSIAYLIGFPYVAYLQISRLGD
ncbi:hypothetical protein PINS_up000769 [Pythium insidiosum]|nr:hypothetical protein PINS_up000769 [Pythium insidiosum]